MGLTAAGYDMADPQDEAVQGIIVRIRSVAEWPPEMIGYFAAARTGRAEVNPYWPRASLLSSTSLFIGPDHLLSGEAREELERVVLGADNLSPKDKAPDVLSWLTNLPEALAPVMKSPAFPSLWLGYLAVIEGRGGGWEAEVMRAVIALEETLGLPADEHPRVDFVPSLLQSPHLADYAMTGDTLRIIATRPDGLSIVHELLHQVLDRPVREAVLEVAEASGSGTEASRGAETFRDREALRDRVNLEKMRALGYAWDDTLESVVRVLQETWVRAASLWIMYKDDPERAEDGARGDVARGFRLEPEFLRSLRKDWAGLGSAKRVLAGAIREHPR